ncbi:MAG: sigma 54-interacting transcriptional regulator [Candidatus Poribacteria bacterium]
MKKVLVIDDEEKVCWAFEQFLKDEGYKPIIANNAEEGLKKVETERPDIVILDVRLPGMDGLEALKQIKSLNPGIHVIIITAFDFFETTIKAMQLDAFDFVTKPPDLDEIREIIDRAIKAQELSQGLIPPEIEPADRYQLDKLVGESSQMQEIYKLIGAITTNNVNVLIEGENGTGKELVAKAIHYNGPRKDKPFVPVNCGALPDSLLESELFGYEKGAFTGADTPKKGRFELADGGTLFLDEVSTMSSALQVKLLRVLEEQEFEPLGGTETIKVDVRIIAATNENLESLVQSGTFREDLYYRLKVISFNLPPLRERPGDIPLLVNHFLAAANLELGKQLKGLDRKAMDLLLKYDWPGNVRELENAIKRAAVLSRSDVILIEHLPPEIIAGPRKAEREASALESALENILNAKVKQAINQNGNNLYDDILSIVDKLLVNLVLQEVNGNQVKAAQLLGISRTTLREKIKKFGI